MAFWRPQVEHHSAETRERNSWSEDESGTEEDFPEVFSHDCVANGCITTYVVQDWQSPEVLEIQAQVTRLLLDDPSTYKMDDRMEMWHHEFCPWVPETVLREISSRVIARDFWCCRGCDNVILESVNYCHGCVLEMNDESDYPLYMSIPDLFLRELQMKRKKK